MRSHNILILSCLFLLLLSACNRRGKSKGSGSLSTACCNCLEENKQLSGQALIDSCDVQVLADALNGMPDDVAADSLMQAVNDDLIKNCKAYKKLVEESPEAVVEVEDWSSPAQDAKPTISSDACSALTENQKFFYIEASKDTTFVTLQDGMWTESMKAGKYFSKLSFEWEGDCSFRLTFTSSNHPVKAKASKKGQTYTYTILSRQEDHFIIVVNLKDKPTQFRLFLLPA